jgi:multicomponent Na+:H+ antiporter subunit G
MSAPLADILTILGLVVVTIGVYGLVHLPDAYTQLHSASKASFVGVAALLIAAATGGDGGVVARAVLIVALLSVTTPVAAHAVGRAAHRRGEPMQSPDPVDESQPPSTGT